MKEIKQFIENNNDRILNELFDLLKIKSVSADSNYKNDVKEAAIFLKNNFQEIGCDNIEIIETAGHPIVYAEKIVSKNAPTVLVYGHYDVQPADPIELWDNPPFDPIIKKTKKHPKGAIYARGACDDKGQMFMHLKAFEYMKKFDKLKCNIKFMIEGEEEVGSVNLEKFLIENKNKLANDVILISDTGMIANDIPSITTGLRGLSYVEVEVTGPDRDLHSGLYGGAVANPINVLSKMISSLQDENNKITIPGFYDKVSEMTNEERIEVSKIPFSKDNYQSEIGIESTYGEKGYVTNERNS